MLLALLLVKHKNNILTVLETTEPGRECLSYARGEWLLTPGRANTTIAGWVWTKTGETGGFSTTQYFINRDYEPMDKLLNHTP